MENDSDNLITPIEQRKQVLQEEEGILIDENFVFNATDGFGVFRFCLTKRNYRLDKINNFYHYNLHHQNEIILILNSGAILEDCEDEPRNIEDVIEKLRRRHNYSIEFRVVFNTKNRLIKYEKGFPLLEILEYFEKKEINPDKFFNVIKLLQILKNDLLSDNKEIKNQHDLLFFAKRKPCLAPQSEASKKRRKPDYFVKFSASNSASTNILGSIEDQPDNKDLLRVNKRLSISPRTQPANASLPSPRTQPANASLPSPRTQPANAPLSSPRNLTLQYYRSIGKGAKTLRENLSSQCPELIGKYANKLRRDLSSQDSGFTIKDSQSNIFRSSRLLIKNNGSKSTSETETIFSPLRAKSQKATMQLSLHSQEELQEKKDPPLAPKRIESLTLNPPPSLTLNPPPSLPERSSSLPSKDKKELSKNSNESNVDGHDLDIYEYRRDKTFNQNKYGIYNEKKTNNVNKTKISFLYRDQSADKTNIESSIIEEEVKKSITDAIKEISNGSNDSKLKFYQYLVIAIKCGGVKNKGYEYKHNLLILNKEISEDKDKFYFSEAKKLSLLFQKNSEKNNIFTGRIDEEAENINVVGMRTKRIPLKLLYGLARNELNTKDFEVFEKFLFTQFFSSKPETVFSIRNNTASSKEALDQGQHDSSPYRQ